MLEPTWRLEARQKGQGLVVGGYNYHPGVDPARQGRMNAMELAVTIERQGGKRAMLLGVGLGYLAAPLAALLDIPLTIWDSMPWVAPRERRMRLLEAGLHARVVRSEEEVAEVLTEDTLVVTHSTAVDLHYWDIQFCEARFSHLNRKQIKVVSQRSTDFLRRLPNLGLVQEHYGLAGGLSVVLVSPGPTLDVVRVKGLQEIGFPVIAAAQALPVLTAAGVVPNITVCLDPQPVIFDALQKGKPGCIYADAMSDPRIWDTYPDKCFAFSVPTSHCHAVIWREMGLDWLDDPAITVSEVMLEIASKLGFSTVITSGVDYWAPMRTDLLKMECQGNRWSWAHYYAGARAWEYMIRKYQMGWQRAEEVPQEMGTQRKLELPGPSSKIREGLVESHLQKMLSQQPEVVQKKLLEVLPASVRASFSPLTSMPVVVHT